MNPGLFPRVPARYPDIQQATTGKLYQSEDATHQKKYLFIDNI
jgi:hypothetical protein